LNSYVILRGESGTGKEIFARLIHELSPRKAEPFISINCAALPENLLENELFGHEKGAYTDAHESAKGKFELANHGTLFLDEIGDMSLKLQAKLLRVVQEQEVQPLGSEQVIKINTRLLFATHQHLEEKVKDGSFREDLYYRIHIFPIHIPSLRERTDDIPLLVHHFIEVYCLANNLPKKDITEKAVAILQNYRWKGNIRELENVIQQMIILSEESVMDVNHIPGYILGQEKMTPADVVLNGKSSIDFKHLIREYEKGIIEKALMQNDYAISQTAKLLKISRGSLRYKIEEYQIPLKKS